MIAILNRSPNTNLSDYSYFFETLIFSLHLYLKYFKFVALRYTINTSLPLILQINFFLT